MICFYWSHFLVFLLSSRSYKVSATISACTVKWPRVPHSSGLSASAGTPSGPWLLETGGCKQPCNHGISKMHGSLPEHPAAWPRNQPQVSHRFRLSAKIQIPGINFRHCKKGTHSKAWVNKFGQESKPKTNVWDGFVIPLFPTTSQHPAVTVLATDLDFTRTCSCKSRLWASVSESFLKPVISPSNQTCELACAVTRILCSTAAARYDSGYKTCTFVHPCEILRIVVSSCW